MRGSLGRGNEQQGGAGVGWGERGQSWGLRGGAGSGGDGEVQAAVRQEKGSRPVATGVQGTGEEGAARAQEAGQRGSGSTLPVPASHPGQLTPLCPHRRWAWPGWWGSRRGKRRRKERGLFVRRRGSYASATGPCSSGCWASCKGIRGGLGAGAEGLEGRGAGHPGGKSLRGGRQSLV